MKKSFALLALAPLALWGCGPSSSTSEEKQVLDMSLEANKLLVLNRVSEVVENTTSANAFQIGLSANLEDLDYSEHDHEEAYASSQLIGSDVNSESITNANGYFELNFAAKDDPQTGITAALTASLEASLGDLGNEDNIASDYSLILGTTQFDKSAAAYVKNNNLYIDASDLQDILLPIMIPAESSVSSDTLSSQYSQAWAQIFHAGKLLFPGVIPSGLEIPQPSPEDMASIQEKITDFLPVFEGVTTISLTESGKLVFEMNVNDGNFIDFAYDLMNTVNEGMTKREFSQMMAEVLYFEDLDFSLGFTIDPENLVSSFSLGLSIKGMEFEEHRRTPADQTEPDNGSFFTHDTEIDLDIEFSLDIELAYGSEVTVALPSEEELSEYGIVSIQ